MQKTLVHKRVELSNQGKNEKAIIRLKSGWVVMGDDQTIPGYCLLLSDPVAETINDLSADERKQFLLDMTAVGDALISVLNPRIINYSIMENSERALHAHIHPRYDWEDEENRKMPPFIYKFKNTASVNFDLDRDSEIKEKIKQALEKIIQ